MRLFVRGFTLIEVLVVTGIVAVLTTILITGFVGARESSRDAQRQTDLKQLQLIVEEYKNKNGVYPAAGCSASSWAGVNWGTPCTFYIEDLVPEYLLELPVDPGDGSVANTGYIYRTNGDQTAYKIVALRSVESAFITGYDDKFARCPYDCGVSGSFWCGASPEPNSYAVYSPGAECF